MEMQMTKKYMILIFTYVYINMHIYPGHCIHYISLRFTKKKCNIYVN